MKNLIKLFCINCFLFIGCISLIEAGEQPLWLENPTSLVKKDDIYAIGNGTTLPQAQQHARSEILKYFETNVSSSFMGNLTSTDEVSFRQIEEQNKEEVIGIVQGVSMLRSYKDKEGYYVLSVLDKHKAQKIIKQDIEVLDSQLKHLLSEPQVDSFLFKQVYQKREKLNQKYLLLTGTTLALDIPDDKIPNFSYTLNREITEKRANMGKISVSVIPANQDLQMALESHLTALGYILNARGKVVVVELKKQECQSVQKVWTCQQMVKISFKKRIFPYTVKEIGKTQEEAIIKLKKALISNFPQELYQF